MAAPAAGIQERPELQQIVLEAQRLRDYVLRLGKPEVGDLVDALLPFETNKDMPPEPAQCEALYLAFQHTKSALTGLVDDYTINRVLAGRSPFTTSKRVWRWLPRLLRDLGVTGLGVMLVGLTLFYTVWSNTAADLILRAEAFAEFDHRSEIMRLVEIADAAGLDLEQDLSEAAIANSRSNGERLSALDPQTVLAYEMVGRLNSHYLEQNDLNTDLRRHVNAFPIHEELFDRLRKRNCKRPVPAQENAEGRRWELVEPEQGWFGHSLVDGLLTCPDYKQFLAPQPSAQGGQTGGQPSRAREEDQRIYILDRFNTVDEINALIEDEIYDITGRNEKMPGWPYPDAVKVMEQLASELSNQVSVVHRWLLPIFYGMMGSVMYCLWRILNPPTAPLDFLYTFMRTAFAGLAALTLSMLILPANVLSLPFETTRPAIYLVAFLFGYSIETFVNYLNALNRWLSARISVRNKEEAAPPKAGPAPAGPGAPAGDGSG